MEHYQISRNIRVFISSTFNDMQEERDYLVNKVFPKLRLEAQQRNINVTELDLRWGVIDAAKVIPICLEEIDNSRPFFIGIIGDRYGWCPSEEELMQNQDLAERFGWIREDLKAGLSITEIEMQYGVFRNTVNLNALFYIKKEKQKTNDLEENADKLRLLKDTIRKNSRYPVSNYSTPEDLGKQVEAAFIKMLKKKFPMGKKKNPLGEIVFLQSIYLNTLTDTYVPDGHIINIVNDFLNNNESFLAITGETGIGKSALLAHLYRTHENDKSMRYIYYRIGLNYSFEEPSSFLEYIAYNLQAEKPHRKSSETIYKSIVDLEDIIANIHKPILILLDEINKLTSDNKFLGFLTGLPENVKVIFSMKEDSNLSAAFMERNYSILEMGKMSEDNRKAYISNYLGKYGKELTPRQIERIVSDESCGNPLLLRAFLDELVCFGVYEQIDERINYYLGTHNDMVEFYSRILKRYERCYGDNVTEKALALMAISSDYLSENLLFSMLKVSRIEWMQFYCVIHKYLNTNDGRFILLDSPFKEAVCRRYFKQGKDIQYRNQIISFLEPLFEPTRITPSKFFSELAYQYYHIGDYDRLFDCISTINAFESIDKTTLLQYWKTLLKKDPKKYNFSVYLNSPYWLSPFEEFSAFLLEAEEIEERREEEKGRCLEMIGDFIRENSLDCAYSMIELYSKALTYYPDSLSLALKLAFSFIKNHEYAKAIDRIDRVLNSTSETDKRILAESYGLLSLAHEAIGNKDEALRCKQRMASYEKTGGFHLLSQPLYTTIDGCQHTIDLIIGQNGKSDPVLVKHYVNLSKLFKQNNDISKAVASCREAIYIGENIGRSRCCEDLYQAYFNLILFLQHLGEYNESAKFIDQFADLEQESGKTPEHSSALRYHYYYHIEDYENAIECMRKNLTSCIDKYGQKSEKVASCLISLANTYHAHGQDSNALSLSQQAINVLESLPQNKPEDIAMIHHSMFSIYNRQKKYEEALIQVQIERDILLKISPNHHSLTKCYIQIGTLMKEEVLVLDYYNKALDIAKKNQIDYDISTCFSAFADYYLNIADYDKAIESYRQSLDIRLRIYKQNENSIGHASKIIELQSITIECDMLMILLVNITPDDNRIKEAVSYGKETVDIANEILDEDDCLYEIKEMLKAIAG